MRIPDRAYLWWTWRRVHQRLGLRVDPRQIKCLRIRHGEPDRHYHTWHHVAQTIRFLDVNFATNAQSDLARLALFFHDAVYDSTRKDNEERSALLWEEYGQKIQAQDVLGWERCRMVGDAIRMTKHHQPKPPGDYESGLQVMVSDADISIFIADPVTYCGYALDIWQEYRHVGKAAYLDGRLNFLKSLDPKTLFRSPEALAHVDKAETNIKWEMDSLVTHTELLLS